MKKITLKAYAKINICFDILGKDEASEMHFVDTVMQTIDLADYVTVSKRRDKECFSKVEGDVLEDTNAIKTAKLFVETFDTKGVDIVISKRIPVGAGLGGSSADSAAVLRAMAMLYDIDFGLLTPLAEKIGADVAFLLHGGLARCTGFGEKVERLDPLPPQSVLLAVPKTGVETKEAYARFDKQTKKAFTVRTEDIVNNLREERSNRLLSTNILFNIVSIMNPSVNDAQKFITSDRTPLHATMTGSGSAYYSLYADLEKAYEHLEKAPEGLDVNVYKFVASY